MKKDIVWLDYARFLGIFLVIFAHSLQRIPGWDEGGVVKSLWDYIYLFHMPLFFIISGCLYRQNSVEPQISGISWGGQIWNKLIAPYLLYQLIYLPICLIHYREEIFALDLWRKIFLGLVAGDGYNTPISIVICLPCWFIISIIQLRILFQVITISKLTTLVLTILSITSLVIMRRYDSDLYFCLDCTIMAIPYFLLGHYLGTTKLLEHINNRMEMMVIMIVTGVAVYFIMITNGSAQMNGPTYDNNLILDYLAGISGSMMIFMMSKMIAYYEETKKRVKIISRHTLFLIFFHWLLLYPTCLMLKVIFGRIGTISPTGIILVAITITIVILLISKKMIDYGGNKIPVLFGKHNNK